MQRLCLLDSWGLLPMCTHPGAPRPERAAVGFERSLSMSRPGGKKASDRKRLKTSDRKIAGRNMGAGQSAMLPGLREQRTRPSYGTLTLYGGPFQAASNNLSLNPFVSYSTKTSTLSPKKPGERI